MAVPALDRGVPLVIRDACPSVHEPFAQVDGGLVRIRVPGGTLNARRLRAVSEAATDYGTAVEITSRANLQIRGVPNASHHLLVRDLVAADVTVADAASDARRNVLASPTAGFDPSEISDTRSLVADVTETLAGADGVPLSPKFGVLIDGGGAVHLRGRRQDVCLGAVRVRSAPWAYDVRLAQPLPERSDNQPICVVRPDDAVEFLHGVLDLMTEHSEVGGRLSGLVALLGLDETLDQAAARRGVHLFRLAPTEFAFSAEPSLRPIGVLLQRQTGLAMVGAMPVLGRLSAVQLEEIANVICGRVDEAEVRLTPWRSVVIPNVPIDRAASVLRALKEMGLATDLSDPTLRVVACAGSTGCPSSYSDTQHDGSALVAALRAASPTRPLTIHLSGCSKRCADSTTEFDMTLVGGPTPGSYELITRPGAPVSRPADGGPLDAEGVLADVLEIARSEDA
jgi:precorrin-3B synthase